MQVPFKVDLSKEIAVVTGGGGVLCGMMSKALAECGAAVAVADLKLDAAQQVADEIIAAGGRAIAVACNALDRESLEQAEKEIEEKLGAPTILINGAGGNSPKGTTSMEEFSKEDLLNPETGKLSFYDLDPKGIQFVFDLNVIAALLSTQVFTKKMALAGRGVILNVSSMNAYRPLTKIPAYSAAKAAVSNFTQWLAVHFAKAGIRVNAIAPGFFLTNQNRSLLLNPDGSPTPRSAKIIRNTPMGHYGKPEDLLGALLWLVSNEASSFVTGIVVPIDGGFSAYSGV
ncbi:MAG: SDR family oxidoreductase [Kiritimatiellae bacterium]|nr:SDR family oxidoreductase [Kiritimatiellia bacterium]